MPTVKKPSESATAKPEFPSYKGKPLVRQGNTIYYGHMADKYVIILQIISEKKLEDLSLADDVIIQLVLTDTDIKPTDRIMKKSEKKGLYAALDIAGIWLDRALNR